MADPKAAICYLNGLTLKTINEVEKVLLSLPQTGNKCKLQVVKPVPLTKKYRGTADVVHPGSMKIQDMPKPLTLSPPNRSLSDTSLSSRSSVSSDSFKKFPSSRTNSSVSNVSQRRSRVERRAVTSIVNGVPSDASIRTPLTPKPNYRVLTDKIRVSPIVAINGVVLDIDVEITMPESGEKKIVKLEIECPNYVPARIKIGGKWKKIV